MLDAHVQTVVPAAPHDQQHKHGGSEQPAQGAGWYILRCGSGLDFPAEQAVRDAGWKVFLARERKWRPSTIRRKPVETEYPRFPGYLFLAVSPPCWPDLEAWPFSRYVHGILGMDGQPVAVAPAEMDRLMAEDGQLARPTHMHMAYVPGQTVRVLVGAFRDFTAALDDVDEGGARITVQLFGRPAEVRLPLTWLEAV